MLELKLSANEFFNEASGEFVSLPEINIQMEHSLVSISKWESYWKTPFLSKDNKSLDELVHYFQCMVITENVNPLYFTQLSPEDVKKIASYISDTMTATTVKERPSKKKKARVVTAELIYYWMVALQIPFECQHWHLNRLMTLIKVTNLENNPEKMSKREAFAENRRLNEQRKQQLQSKG